MVIDDPGNEVADALQQLVEIENRRQLAADLVEKNQRLGLLGNARVEPSVFDGDSRSDDGQQVAMFFGKEVRRRGLDVDDADDTILDDERDGELGTDADR